MPTEQWLTRPLKEFIRTVAFSVAESQEEFDRRSQRVQKEIDQAIAEGDLDYDLDASWLRFSEVEAQLEVALSLEGEEIVDPHTNEVRAYRPIIGVTPVSLRAKNEFDLDADFASEVTLRITPVPPERERQ